MKEKIDKSEPGHIFEELRHYGFGNYLFAGRLSEFELEGLKGLVLTSRKLQLEFMSAEDHLVRMWGEFQIGETEHSLTSANMTLGLAEKGSDQYLTALNCKIYLTAKLNRFRETSQSVAEYQTAFDRKKQNRKSRFLNKLNW
jgi:hypothetical protein